MKTGYVILLFALTTGFAYYLYDKKENDKLRKQFESLKGTQWEKLGESGIKMFGL